MSDKQKGYVIQSRWDSFKAQLVAAGAGSAQVDEMRRAFYAGIAEMMSIDEEICCDPDLSLQEVHDILNGMLAEINDYRKQLEQEAADYAKATERGV